MGDLDWLDVLDPTDVYAVHLPNIYRIPTPDMKLRDSGLEIATMAVYMCLEERLVIERHDPVKSDDGRIFTVSKYNFIEVAEASAGEKLLRAAQEMVSWRGSIDSMRGEFNQRRRDLENAIYNYRETHE